MRLTDCGDLLPLAPAVMGATLMVGQDPMKPFPGGKKKKVGGPSSSYASSCVLKIASTHYLPYQVKKHNKEKKKEKKEKKKKKDKHHSQDPPVGPPGAPQSTAHQHTHSHGVL